MKSIVCRSGTAFGLYESCWRLQDGSLEKTCPHGFNTRRRPALDLETAQPLQSTKGLGVREPSHQGQDSLLAGYPAFSNCPSCCGACQNSKASRLLRSPRGSREGVLLYSNCARIKRFHSVRVTFERKEDSPDLLETLVVRSNGWSWWSRVVCAQGRRAARCDNSLARSLARV